MTAQHMDALAKANSVYRERAQIKREIHAGIKPVAPLVMKPPKAVAKITPADLMCCLTGFQRRIAEDMVHAAEASLTRTIGGLTPRQRSEIAAQIADWESDKAKRVEKRERLAA